jgi:hypothetical protein
MTTTANKYLSFGVKIQLSFGVKIHPRSVLNHDSLSYPLLGSAFTFFYLL